MMQSLEQSAAVNSLLYIVITLLCISLSWWGLQQFRFDLFLRHPKSPPSVILQIFLAVALGSIVAQFFIGYFNWSSLLKGLF